MSAENGGLNLYIVVLSADIIAFISGTSIAWSSPVLPILQNDDSNPLGRKITDDEGSWIGSLAAMGGVFGPIIFSFLVQIVGRKLTVALMAVPFLTAYLIAAFAEIVPLYYVSRFLMGMGVGGAFGILPIFIVEVAESTNRGLLQATTTTSIMLGLLFSFCIGPYTSIMVFNIILATICVVFVPVFWYISRETPYFLIGRNNEEEAFQVLRYLRQRADKDIREEFEMIKEHVEQMKPASFWDIFKTKGTTKAFLLAVALITFQQFSGVTVILYFAQNIFDASGSNIAPEICSIIVGSAQFIVSVISPAFLDRVGKKLLLQIAVTGAVLAETILGVYFFLQKNGDDVSGIGWLPVTSLVMFIAFYNFGMGSIPWAIMGEILPLNVIAKASMVITSFYWVTGFFLTKYFGALSDEIGMAGSFWMFAGFCVLFDLFVYFFMFETKGKSLAEIQDILNE